MSASLESLLHAFSNLFSKLNSKPKIAQKKLTFCEDEVKSSLDMASKALEQKNHVIHALQLKLSELANEVDAAAAFESCHLSVGSPSAGSIGHNIASPEKTHSSGASSPSHCSAASLLNASLLLQLQQANTKLQLAEAALEAKDDEISRLSSKLCAKEIDLLEALSSTQEQESAVQELAYMLAAREASHGALIDTVHAFVSQNVSSLPPTPRDAVNTPAAANTTTAGGDEGAAENAKKLETMVSFWQERLEAHVTEVAATSSSTLKVKQLFPTADDGLTTDEDEEEEECDGNSSDGDTVTPPTDRKSEGIILPCSTALGPVTPL